MFPFHEYCINFLIALSDNSGGFLPKAFENSNSSNSYIRSYVDETIEFTDSSILLTGDIGCGKSTVLLAAEFALAVLPAE